MNKQNNKQTFLHSSHTVVANQKSRRGIKYNHSQTSMSERKACRGIKNNHNQTVVATEMGTVLRVCQTEE